MKRLFSAIVMLLFAISTVVAQQSSSLLLDRNWRFSRQESSDFMQPSFDDSQWQKVTVPHDWAIYGPFSIHNDKQNTAITQDGQKEAMEHAGRTGGLPFVGKGFYRTTFDIPNFDINKHVSIIFDGAMSNAHVYINGQLVGNWPYGYNTFHFDITKYIHPDGRNNTVAVALENLPESSRWYPGAGLYRNVHVVTTHKVHIPIWGTQITTPQVNGDYAKITVKTAIEHLPVGQSNYFLHTAIQDVMGTVVAQNVMALNPLSEQDSVFEQNFIVKNPVLWDLDSPHLYTAVQQVYHSDMPDNVPDTYRTTFGIRTIQIIPNKGFFLNGKKVSFKGVCNHHDLGPLGAAVNEAAIRRQVKIMKDMGANAIRTSHNMPAPELVKACNEMGMMLMIETFDEWRKAKVANGYHRYFDKWAEKDLVNVIHHFRNDPSVVMWCIGNEVPDQWSNKNAAGAKIERWLQDICHREDPTRFVTNGMDAPDAVIKNGMATILDVAGFNYRPFKYPEAYNLLSQNIILGTETASTISSRGVYKFPVERKSMAKYPDHQASSYDVEHCGWSDLPEDNFIMHDDLPYCIGEFVWTGFDYLGEPTPYYSDWPSHSSLFGIVDLAGIPKDRFYLYRSHWNTKENTLHIVPHWTFPNKIGDTVPVFVYTNYPSAELFINGKSQGRITKDTSVKATNTKHGNKNFERQKRYRLMWMNTVYESGTLKVVAYDANGKVAETKEVHTAGKPYRIELEVDRNVIKADGKDIAFVNVKVVDKNGNICPDDTRKINFKVKGKGVFRAAANGNPVSLELFHLPQMQLFSGQLTALVQSTEQPGKITFEASAKGVKNASITLTAQ